MNIDLHTFESNSYSVNVSHFRMGNPKGVLYVFPGAGYSFMGPCLYYPTNLFLDNEYDVLNFEYDFRQNRLRDESQEGYASYCSFLIEQAKKLNLPNKKIVLSKSLGTRIVASRLEENFFDGYIWLTPALKNGFVHKAILTKAKSSLCAIGTKDPHYDTELVDIQKSLGVAVELLEGADHGLDIEGNPLQSLKIMDQLIRAISGFMRF